MKISIYELLGLIKDDKAPKKIRFKNEEWFWGYDTYTTIGCLGNTPDAQYSMFSRYRIDYCLNDKVEIIEEEKEIKKLGIDENDYLHSELGNWKMRKMDKAFAIKINELIDEIKKLKESK